MKKIFALALIPMLIPETAFAHAGEGSGFYDGLTHPVGGLDHLLAMLAVGILSTQIGHRHIWWVPTTFVTIMLVGGAMGSVLPDIPMVIVEHGIVLSVITLGLVIAMGGNLPIWLTYSFVAIFGFFHGYAHGVEMPSLAQPIYYASGFVISTIMIHIVGVIIGYLYAVGKATGMQLLRYTGAAIMGAGLHMLLEEYL